LSALADVRDGLDTYREQVERAAELDEQIERTDELIDGIVYDLYGLTDEEIETVEEPSGTDRPAGITAYPRRRRGFHRSKRA
jgi:hypothetical protein